MHNTEPMYLFTNGQVEVTDKGILVTGFQAHNAGCRELAIMACAWAIGELQREMLRTIEEPGGGNITIG